LNKGRLVDGAEDTGYAGCWRAVECVNMLILVKNQLPAVDVDELVGHSVAPLLKRMEDHAENEGSADKAQPRRRN
jgi:hypothetical protein